VEIGQKFKSTRASTIHWNWSKVQVNACKYYSLEPRNSASWHANCVKTIEKKARRPL
jgi:hypothetical protein